MKEKITLCGDNCVFCPRYNASTAEELEAAAELWYRIGWRDTVPAPDEMRCNGCSSHKNCTYHLVECTLAHNVEKCSNCLQFPCERIDELLSRSAAYQKRCAEVCSAEEYSVLEKAFFHKEENLRK